jgi:chemotaxis protein CheD
MDNKDPLFNSTNHIISVGIGDFGVTKSPTILETVSLGSCVGIALYDPFVRVGGLAHIMLPDSTQSKNVTSPGKYADTAITLMIADMLSKGAMKERMVAKIAGGACMFALLNLDPLITIGDRNIKAVKEHLAKLTIPIVAEDTGKNHGRTVHLFTENGRMTVRSVKFGIKEI